jgi:hypothetical protein
MGGWQGISVVLSHHLRQCSLTSTPMVCGTCVITGLGSCVGGAAFAAADMLQRATLLPLIQRGGHKCGSAAAVD